MPKILSSLLLCFSVAPSLALSTTSSLHEKVAVWDNVISESVRTALHEEAKASGLGHFVFSRPLIGEASNTLLEQTLDSILTQLGDSSSRYVEYWSRQEWRHIEAHADVDENLAKEQDRDHDGQEQFRYPDKGHVLYLKVGKEVRGPTCVFPNTSTGGQLSRPQVELITVPAVEGRLLRFDGNLLHAVPRPTDIWFLPFVQGGPDFLPEETYGRSVILFNTWPEQPPTDVVINDQTCDATGSKTVSVVCNSKLTWEQQEIMEVPGGPTAKSCKAKIWLLGNERRRDFSMRTVNLPVPEITRDALHEASIPLKIMMS